MQKIKTCFAFLPFVLNLIAVLIAVEDARADPTSQSAPPTSKDNGKALTKDKSEAEKIDELLTNNSLRAESGSTSTWSIASLFNYNGGTISSPFSENRPNIASTSQITNKTDLDGSVSVKYNINVKNSLMLGFGIRWIAPFTTGPLTEYAGTRFDAMNPYVQYQYLYKWFGIQSVLQVQLMKWTQADQTALGAAEQLSVNQDNMYPIGDSGFTVGASTYILVQRFSKTNDDISPQQSVFAFGISPELEYEITSKINFRTVLNLPAPEYYKNGTWSWDTMDQSIGVNFAITRDILLYPNIQFLPQNLKASLTNVGLQATINVF